MREILDSGFVAKSGISNAKYSVKTKIYVTLCQTACLLEQMFFHLLGVVGWCDGAG